MRQLLVLVALLGLFGAAAVANPVCVVDGTLQSYETNYATQGSACQIGDKLFWGFNLTAGPSNTPGAGPSAAGIQVQPLPGDGLTNIGIAFNSGGWAVSNSITIDYNLTYNVTTFSALPLIKDLTLTITGTLTGTSGSAGVTETVSPAVSGTPLVASLPGTTSAHTDFIGSPVTTLAVTDHLHLVGGTRFTDLAHISVIENDFSELVNTPEPTMTVLIGSGLLLFGVARRKFAHRSSFGGTEK